MEKEEKRKIFNAAMIAIIVLIIAFGIYAVGNVKGWFSNSDSSFAEAKDIVGVVSVERKGVSFNISKDTPLESGDVITTNEKAYVTIASSSNTVYMNENSEIKVGDTDGNNMDIAVNNGEIFLAVGDDDNLGKIIAQGNEITCGEATFSINVQIGSMGINVFEGKVTVKGQNDMAIAKAGQAISIVGDEMTVIDLNITSLNDFNLERAQEVGKERPICFTYEELQKVIEDRQLETYRADEEANSNGESITVKDAEANTVTSDTNDTSKNSGTDKSSNSNTTTGGNSATSENYGTLSCTIEIRCDTIFNNMENLEPGKEGYVPKNGTILPTTNVQFTEGETVFEVLNRVCKNKGIQIEYSWTPMYGSYYIEGINNLYEFDCGNESGWMYKVNGWFPNYGCSSYKLKDGDTIVWCYTSNGLGADVGGSVY